MHRAVRAAVVSLAGRLLLEGAALLVPDDARVDAGGVDRPTVGVPDHTRISRFPEGPVMLATVPARVDAAGPRLSGGTAPPTPRWC